MTLSLVIDCGAAETTAALVSGNEIIRFFFAPARGDEAVPRRLEAGDIVFGRIKKTAPALSGAFVDIGGGDAFLPAKKDGAPVEGAPAIFRVTRPPLGGKGAVLSADWRQSLPQPIADALAKSDGAPRLLSAGIDSAVLIALRAQMFAPASISLNRADAAAALAASGFSAVVDERAVDEIAIEEAIAQALEPEIALGEGARMLFSETPGGAVIDIDAGSASNDSRKPNDRVNAMAAMRLFPELSRRGIGGRVIVDFLPPSSAAARRALLEKLLAETGDLYERRLGKLAPDGLLDLTAPRRDFSLLERASETSGEGALVQGRQATLDWAAKRAVAALERRLRRQPRHHFALEAGAEIMRYLKTRPQWRSRLAERHGARFDFRLKERLARSFDVAEI
jgi:Ribonuclease G/E